MYRSWGRVRYDPVNYQTRQDPWWAIVECDLGITAYYRWFLRKRGIDITYSSWGPHISVVRGERPRHPDRWRAHQASKVSFTYTGELASNGKHFWVPVQSPTLEDIREELGLARTKPGLFHLTIGVLPDHIPYPPWLEDINVHRR